MQDKKVVTIISNASAEYKRVPVEDLKPLSVADQFELLERNGYLKGPRNPFVQTFVNEWNQILCADTDGYVAEKYVDLLSTERFTVPFILKDQNGTVIDEYNFILIYYWDTDPARLIAKCWIRGGEKEEAWTMPLSNGSVSGGCEIVSDDFPGYVLTKHDVKCFEERLSFRFSGLTEIVSLSNGRFVLATNVWDNGISWNGFPVSGNGDRAQYGAAIIKYLFFGVDYDALYDINKDSNMTFSNREEAKAWAQRIGIKLEQ